MIMLTNNWSKVELQIQVQTAHCNHSVIMGKSSTVISIHSHVAKPP